MEGSTFISAIVAVWQAILNFLSSTFMTVTTFFWENGQLTFAGTLAVIMAGVAMVLLVFNLIRSFLPMRG